MRPAQGEGRGAVGPGPEGRGPGPHGLHAGQGAAAGRTEIVDRQHPLVADALFQAARLERDGLGRFAILVPLAQEVAGQERQRGDQADRAGEHRQVAPAGADQALLEAGHGRRPGGEGVQDPAQGGRQFQGRGVAVLGGRFHALEQDGLQGRLTEVRQREAGSPRARRHGRAGIRDRE